jgi:hypothetical protein
MTGKATWICFTLAAASAVWGGEASAGKGPPKVGGEVEIADVPFDINEVVRTVRKNPGLPEEPPRQGFHAEARGERPFASKGGGFTHSTPRFQAEVGEDGLRYFAQGSKEKPDFEILSVSFERGGVPRWGRGKSQTVFGKGRLEERAPGVLQGEARDGITPYVRNRGEEGIELYWTIDEPLSPETSALRVCLAIRAAGEPQEHSEGLVFPARESSGQIAFSNMTIVDSAGRTEQLRPSFATSDEIAFEVTQEFLASAQYPILIDPTVGPEFPVEPSPALVPSEGESPSIATNGSNFFVVWSACWGGCDIFGSRVTTAGTVLDKPGILVSGATGFQRRPAVASNGTNYFVVWDDSRSGVGSDVYGTRVTAAGSVLDPSGIPVSTGMDDQLLTALSTNGTDYFVVWRDYRSGTDWDIYGARVASAGTVLDPTGIAVSTAANSQWNPSVASNGTDYFVVWHDSDIYGARVTAAGTVLDPTGIAISTLVGYPSVASNGTDYFVVWHDGDIYGARVTAVGTVLDPTGIAVSTAASDQRLPSVASNGTGYFVAWEDRRNQFVSGYDIYGSRVTGAGTVLDAGGIPISKAPGDQVLPSVAAGTTDYFLVWQDEGGSAVGARVQASDGALLDGPPESGGIDISFAASSQRGADVGSDGSTYLVAWQDWRDYDVSGRDIYGVRVASDGTVLDPSGIAICTAENDQGGPSVTSNGTDYFVVWSDGRTISGIYGARIRSVDGVLLDGPPDTGGIIISTEPFQYHPDAASLNGDYFVVWTDRRNWATTAYDIYGTPVSSDGTVLDPAGIAVSSTAASHQRYPSVASNGTDYFVVWQDGRNSATSDVDIYGTRIDAKGGLLDGPPDTGGIAVSTAADDQDYPSVASNGSDFFVVWRDFRNKANTNSYDIFGARVRGSDGVLLDDPVNGIGVCTEKWYQQYPAVAYDGVDYLVVWEDQRRDWPEIDLYGSRVTASGTVLEPSGFMIQQDISSGFPFSFSTNIAHSSCGNFMVAYRRFYDDPAFRAMRVLGRTISTAVVTFDPSFLPTLVEICGDGDLVAELGEEWLVTVQLYNYSSCTANNVMADLTINAVSPNSATVYNNPGTYGDIPPWSTSQYGYAFIVDAAATCADYLIFDVENLVSDEGSHPAQIPAFAVLVGGSNIFWEDFSSGIPASWTVVDGPGIPDGNTWTSLDPCNRAASSDIFAICDSDCAGFVDMDEQLITPLLDCSSWSKVTLQFDHTFLYYESEVGDVKVRSSKTNAVWVPKASYSGLDATERVVLDISAEAAGATDVELNWHYYNANYEWLWAVDNVIVNGSNPCSQVTCSGTYLQYDTHTFTDCGNGNGAIDPGESIDLSVTLKNAEIKDLFNINGVLSTSTPGILIPTNSAAFPDMPFGSQGTSLTPFQLFVDPGVSCGTLIDFQIDLTYEDGKGVLWPASISFQEQVTAGCNANCGCVLDSDADGLVNCADNCPVDANPLQEDADGDGVGDACDACPGFDDTLDTDGDGLADACDPCPAVPSVPSGCTPVGGAYPTDINCDGCVDGMDLGSIGRAFGEFCGDPYYNADADLDASGAVDGADLDALVADFGSGCT